LELTNQPSNVAPCKPTEIKVATIETRFNVSSDADIAKQLSSFTAGLASDSARWLRRLRLRATGEDSTIRIVTFFTLFGFRIGSV
jgi:hypothetical protein